MVIDSSALVAILLGEPEAERLTTALAADPVRCISALSVLETSIVLYRRKGAELGDCCSYALASNRKQPLLYKGEDFPQTDLPVVALDPPESLQVGTEDN